MRNLTPQSDPKRTGPARGWLRRTRRGTIEPDEARNPANALRSAMALRLGLRPQSRSDRPMPQRGIGLQPNVALKTFGAALGFKSAKPNNLNEVVAACLRKRKAIGRNRVAVGSVRRTMTQGSPFGPTLGFGTQPPWGWLTPDLRLGFYLPPLATT